MEFRVVKPIFSSSENESLWEGAECSKNKGHSKPYYYCMRCDEMFCDDCWSEQRKHQNRASGHERTVPNDAMIVHSTLKVDLNDWVVLKDAIERSRDPKLYNNLVGDNSEWFGVSPKNQAGGCSLVEGPAYDLMADSFWTSTSDIYPGLVSFVGATGSGKSSLISLLSKFSHSEFKNLFKTPVVGESGSYQSTSSNVHLYADPQTFLTENPVLYADCEGLHGNEIPTEMTKSLVGASASGDPLSHSYHTPERDIAWSKEPSHSGAWTRRDITKTLFPRILYIFSDVVVFIPYNRIDLETAILNLIEWGHSATIQSYNKPVLPSVIMTFINRDGQVTADNYDLAKARESFFAEVAKKNIFRDSKLEKFIKYWEDNGQQIASVEGLLHCYYSSVSVVQFPSGKDPTTMRQQIERFYGEITIMCSESRKQRDEAWMKWNAVTLPLFIRKAFTHFASNYDTAFNFSDAWVDLRNISFNFDGSIFNLARMVRAHRELSQTGMELWDDISGFVASCLFLNCVRTKQPECRPPEKLWKQCNEATEQYWMKFWPCRYRIETPNGLQQCVNAPSGHPHHQGGKAVMGDDRGHMSSHTLEQLQEKFRDRVEKAFLELKSKLKNHGDDYKQLQEASKVHLEKTRDFYGAIGGSRELISHVTCLCDTKFVEMSKMAFTKVGQSKWTEWIGKPAEYVSALRNHGRYSSVSLEEALKKALPQQPLFGGIVRFDSPSVKTAITTSTTRGQVIVLANYNRAPPERGESGNEAWSLVAAKYNCGKHQVIKESAPEVTGSPKSRTFVKDMLEMGLSQFTRSLDSERIWHEWLQARAPGAEFESRYRRLNVTFKDMVPMDDASDEAIKACRKAVQGIPESEFESLADQLIASCFFLRIDTGSIQHNAKWSYECSGVIECRLQPEGIRLLGKHFESLHRLPYFIIKETHATRGESVAIDAEILKRMKSEGEFRLYRDLRVATPLAEMEIFLKMRDTQEAGFHISGLPRRIKDDEDDGKSRSLTFVT
ncbi:hypothetical protein CEP51_011506 [Fusarium floridanum]|uniref:Uncharacterized protein n=1 Tax=Fusarium floridanum TaxID=1325733 RepID=A0A428RAX8_9HYPO|nr:hypothetical protein CEP51_011506 [Fusarium floridanum]